MYLHVYTRYITRIYNHKYFPSPLLKRSSSLYKRNKSYHLYLNDKCESAESVGFAKESLRDRLRVVNSFLFVQFRYINTSKVSYQQNVQPKKDPAKGKRKSPVTWKSLTISGLVGTGLVLYLNYLKQEKDKAIARERRRQLGKAKIGGKFELINTEGKTVKSDDFLGQWVLVYFGFTHCPDVCPDEIEKMTNVVNILGEYQIFKLITPVLTSMLFRDSSFLLYREGTRSQDTADFYIGGSYQRYTYRRRKVPQGIL